MVHRFSYRAAMAMVPLVADALDMPSLRRRDHLRDVGIDSATPLRKGLSELVLRRSGQALDPDGEIGLLTGLGLFAHRFNPVSFYLCFDAAGDLECLVAEVTNTPWHEQYHYVFDTRGENLERGLAFGCAKHFHVSPFMPMDTFYRWRLRRVGDDLQINIAVSRGGLPLFNAFLGLAAVPAGSWRLATTLLRQPLLSLGVSARIYWQALRLRLKSVPFFSHPSYSNSSGGPR